MFPSDGTRTTLCKRRPATTTHSYSLRFLGSINLVSKMPESEDGESSASMLPSVPLSARGADEDGFWHISTARSHGHATSRPLVTRVGGGMPPTSAVEICAGVSYGIAVSYGYGLAAVTTTSSSAHHQPATLHQAGSQDVNNSSAGSARWRRTKFVSHHTTSPVLLMISTLLRSMTQACPHGRTSRTSETSASDHRFAAIA
jgi:hypothetical protein